MAVGETRQGAAVPGTVKSGSLFSVESGKRWNQLAAMWEMKSICSHVRDEIDQQQQVVSVGSALIEGCVSPAELNIIRQTRVLEKFGPGYWKPNNETRECVAVKFGKLQIPDTFETR